MKTIASLLCVIAALACASCASGGTGSGSEGPLRVVVDNAMDDPVQVRIDGRRIGEATANGRTTLPVPRAGIAGRHVSVCVNPAASPGVLCHSGQLIVPDSAREIWIEVQRTGEVSASTL